MKSYVSHPFDTNEVALHARFQKFLLICTFVLNEKRKEENEKRHHRDMNESYFLFLAWSVSSL